LRPRPGGVVPDANTAWDFREALLKAKALGRPFKRLDRTIGEAGHRLNRKTAWITQTPRKVPENPEGHDRPHIPSPISLAETSPYPKRVSGGVQFGIEATPA